MNFYKTKQNCRRQKVFIFLLKFQFSTEIVTNLFPKLFFRLFLFLITNLNFSVGKKTISEVRDDFEIKKKILNPIGKHLKTISGFLLVKRRFTNP